MMWSNVGFATGRTNLKVGICNMLWRITSTTKSMELHSLDILQKPLWVTLSAQYVMLTITSTWVELIDLGTIQTSKFELLVMTWLFCVLPSSQTKSSNQSQLWLAVPTKSLILLEDTLASVSVSNKSSFLLGTKSISVPNGQAVLRLRTFPCTAMLSRL